MKTLRSVTKFLVPVALLLAAPLFADSGAQNAADSGDARGALIRVSKEDAAWADKERAAYPMQACVISGKRLGTMGRPAEFIYRVDGKPDRYVAFCCAGCDEDFLKEPAKHLAAIDEAAKSRDGEVAQKRSCCH